MAKTVHRRPEKEKQKRIKSLLREKLIIFWKGWGCSIFIAVVITTSFKSAIADWNVVPTGSMKPTIVEGDRIFINKLAYDLKIPYTTRPILLWGGPRHGDIVVFYSPEDNRRLVKRIVGLPGDTLAMHNNILTINGTALTYSEMDPSICDAPDRYCFEENFAGHSHPVEKTPGQLTLSSFDAIKVPEGKYFVMGDNRNNSADSRYFGFVERRRIIGRATSVVVSLDIHDHYAPRWERFFTRLP